MKKQYIKIYEPGLGSDLIKVIDSATISPYSKSINGGLGEMVFTLPKKFDDFDEDYVIKLNNRVEVVVSDGQTGPEGVIDYSGFILSYKSHEETDNKYVEVRCFGYVGKLATSILRDTPFIELKTDTSTYLKTGDANASSALISNVVKKILDLYQEEATRPVVDYDTTSVEATTGINMTYIFNGKYFSEAIDKCREFAPAGWYWYVGADNILQFRAKPTIATHTFIYKKHFRDIDNDKSMEGIYNNVLFSNGDNTASQILKRYQDEDSDDEFDDRWTILTDGRVSIEDTADNKGESYLDDNKDPKANITITIVDNNGADDLAGYDIETIEPGQTCKIVNVGDVASKAFNENMQIISVKKAKNYATIELEQLNVTLSSRMAENDVRISEQEESGRANQYDTADDGWHYVGDTGEPAFQNSWENWGASDYGMAYKKLSNGMINLRGQVKRANFASSTVFTLPAGFRPSKYINWNGNNADGYCYGTINPTTGNVEIHSGQSPTSWFFINVMYWAEQ